MIVHRARWVLPIVSPPIRDGWIAVHDGRIVALGGPEDRSPATHIPQAQPSNPPGLPTSGPPATGKDSTAILPGLVNAHTHLELSWMRGQVAPADCVPAWAARVLALRHVVPIDAREPIVDAVREVRAAGTSLIGDITNTLAAFEPLAESNLSAVIFRELLGFNAPRPHQCVDDAWARLAQLTPIARLRVSVVPHAPYSVSPELFRAIAEAAGDHPVSVHLGESADEIDFLRNGTGPWRRLLEQLGVWNRDWTAPGCGPVAYLERFGLVNERLIAVHGVQLADSELARLARAEATIVTCPRSNGCTGAGVPPLERFYASGVRVAIGTDSLASVEDLNVFQELATIRHLVPALSAARLLRSATLDGAEALGFAGELGSIEPGKRAELIAVQIPSDTADVEEYLVSGIDETQIRWLG